MLTLIKLTEEYRPQLNDMMDEWTSAEEKITWMKLSVMIVNDFQIAKRKPYRRRRIPSFAFFVG